VATSSDRDAQNPGGAAGAGGHGQGQVGPVGGALTMQGALLALQEYWTSRGCMVVQPFNTEVGAGTANPATMLRVLGPEPWRVGYVEPSVRPDDARYGENPNRLQTHTQFQVILKPDPGDPQELYLGSLAALGVDVAAHDIRFVEDNWASPALGAWGLGWEVWLDGLEITQFTYFQQAGGLALDPVSVEITYGIERIMMALQGVSHFKDIAYAPGISYGEVFGQAEYEMSRYYLDDADISVHRDLFAQYAAESRKLLDARLPVPAYVCVLKCSHAFNVLDARGAISTTERAKALGQMRALTRDVAQLWTERRQELDHPLGVVAPPAPAAAPVPAALPAIDAPATLLFEIGVEELPHAEVTRVAAATRDALAGKLAATRLGHGRVSAHATPRRIVLLVEDVQPAEPDAPRTARGPRASAAFDPAGQPTKAALGFARGQGVEVGDLVRFEADGVEYVGAQQVDVGRTAAAVLSEVLGELVAQLRSEKNMRWRDAGLSYARPVRWLLALLGDTEIPVTVSSLASGRTTRVHRTAEQAEITVPSADGYPDFLAGHGIVLDGAERRTRILAQAGALAASVGGAIDLDGEAALLDEVANLVEQPAAILGGFAPDYLELPGQILTTVMRKHQRYLPVRDADGKLMPHFVAVANGECDHGLVRAGYESVLRARYEDAAYFWRADLKVSPEQHKAGLAKLTFEERLGSMADRSARIAAVAADLAALAGTDGPDLTVLRRAGELAKFDLASHMVIELSSLAGVMAEEYALRAGEPAQVAAALAEMDQPRTAGGALPRSRPGALLALADRFDLLAGLFALGVSPTGSSDPYGLRRAALGAVAVLRAFPAELAAVTLSAGLAAAARQVAAHGVTVEQASQSAALEFIIARYEQQLLDAGHDHKPVQAVLPLADSPARADATLAQLERLAGQEEFNALAAALQRARRIVPEGTSADYPAGALVEPAELRLHEAVGSVEQRLAAAADQGAVGLEEFFSAAQPLIDPVNTFFDDVLVMAQDPQLRAARLGLLARINTLAAGVLDWRAL
jgi:glycyl-tRNA synthetase